MNGRIVEFELDGAVYPLCFTLRAAEDFWARYNDIDGWMDRLQELHAGGDVMTILAEYVWLLHTLMTAGFYRTAKNQDETGAPPSFDRMCDLVCAGDISRIRDIIIKTIGAGNSREVGVKAPKNGEGAGGE